MSFARVDLPALRWRRAKLALGNLLLATAIVVVCLSSGARGNSLIVPFDQTSGYGFDPSIALSKDYDFGVGDWQLAGDVDQNPAPGGQELLLTWVDSSSLCDPSVETCSTTNHQVEMIWNVSLNPGHEFDGYPGDAWWVNLFLVGSDQNGFQGNQVGIFYDSAEIDALPVAFDVSVYADTYWFLSLNLGPLRPGETREVRFVYEMTGDLLFDSDANRLLYPFITGAAFVVPEPGTAALLALGLVWMGVSRRHGRGS